MGHRQLLAAYRDRWVLGARAYASFDAAEEQATVDRFLTFMEANPRYLERDLPSTFEGNDTGCPQRSDPQVSERRVSDPHPFYGHFTGAALVASTDLEKVLLTHHRKLDIWIQLGGHADGHPLMHQVALREAEEESGLSDFSFLLDDGAHPLPFDLDVHRIPPRPGEPAHYHYDVRYLLTVRTERPVVSEESYDVRWFTLREARRLTAERSMHRQFDKLEWMRHQ